MSNNPYKDYYEARNAPDADEWKHMRAQSISKKIERIREIASLNGISEEEVMARMSNNEMGG